MLVSIPWSIDLSASTAYRPSAKCMTTDAGSLWPMLNPASWDNRLRLVNVDDLQRRRAYLCLPLGRKHARVDFPPLAQPEVDLQKTHQLPLPPLIARTTHLAKHPNRRTRRAHKRPSLPLGNLHQPLVLGASNVLRQLIERKLVDLGQVLEHGREVVDATARVAKEVNARVEEDAIEAVREARDGDRRGGGDKGGESGRGAAEDRGVGGERRKGRRGWAAVGSAGRG